MLNLNVVVTFCLEVKENGSNYKSKDPFCLMIIFLLVLPLANDWWTNCNKTNRNVTNKHFWVILSKDERKSEMISAKTFISH